MLRTRKNFTLPLDDGVKDYVWGILIEDGAVEFHELAEPRPNLVLYNRYDHVDPEPESICEPVNLFMCFPTYQMFKC